MSEDTGERIIAFLESHHVMSLATVGAHGPHAANVFYVRDGFALMWVSHPASRHSTELEADPRVAATIAPDYKDFPDVRGVQIAGRARRLTDAGESVHARTLLEERYPFLKKLTLLPQALLEAFARVAFYRLEPQVITLIDNTRGFGHKDLLEFKTS
jgi:uncharacterized protein YhbP (UPF0306 family)